MRLRQLDDQPTSERGGSALKRVELNLRVVRIEQALDLGTARLHLPRQLALGDPLGDAELFDLPGQNPLHGGRADLFVDTFLMQELVERGSDVRANHHCTSFCLVRVRIRSLFGVFWVFLTNPWSRMSCPSAMQNSTRAILPLEMSLRTSQRP